MELYKPKWSPRVVSLFPVPLLSDKKKAHQNFLPYSPLYLKVEFPDKEKYNPLLPVSSKSRQPLLQSPPKENFPFFVAILQ